MLRTRPEIVVAEYFRDIGYEQPSDILCWSKGTRTDWQGRESWHVDAINSQGFDPVTKNIDLSGLPNEILRSIAENRDFYKRMRGYVKIAEAEQ